MQSLFTASAEETLRRDQPLTSTEGIHVTFREAFLAKHIASRGREKYRSLRSRAT
jgi:hypothetical protein